MTSIDGKMDNRVNDGRGSYIFRLSGQIHRRIETLLPNNGEDSQFAQLYFYDIENEVQHRMDAFGSRLVNKDPDPSIVDALVQMFDESNNLVKIFPMSRDHFIERDIHCLRLHLIGSRTTQGREYHLPTCFEMATIIVGNIGVDNVYRDIIVELKEGGLHRINELDPS